MSNTLECTPGIVFPAPLNFICCFNFNKIYCIFKNNLIKYIWKQNYLRGVFI